jgi:hypothetical protein
MTRLAISHTLSAFATAPLLLTFLVPSAAGKTRSEISMSVVRNLRAVSVPEALATKKSPHQRQKRTTNGVGGTTKAGPPSRSLTEAE